MVILDILRFAALIVLGFSMGILAYQVTRHKIIPSVVWWADKKSQPTCRTCFKVMEVKSRLARWDRNEKRGSLIEFLACPDFDPITEWQRGREISKYSLQSCNPQRIPSIPPYGYMSYNQLRDQAQMQIEATTSSSWYDPPAHFYHQELRRTDPTCARCLEDSFTAGAITPAEYEKLTDALKQMGLQ